MVRLRPAVLTQDWFHQSDLKWGADGGTESTKIHAVSRRTVYLNKQYITGMGMKCDKPTSGASSPTLPPVSCAYAHCLSNVRLPIAGSRCHLFKQLKNIPSHRQRETTRDADQSQHENGRCRWKRGRQCLAQYFRG